MATVVATNESVPNRWQLRLPERLPDLKGRRLTLYTMIWAIMLPLAIIGPVLGTHSVAARAERPVWLPYGFNAGISGGRLQIDGVTSDETRRAGAVAGDRIVAIGGWRVPVSPAVNALARVHAIRPEGASTIFALESPGGAVRNVRLSFRRQHIDDYYASAGVTFAMTISFIIGANLAVAAALLIPAIVLFARERRRAVPAFLSLGFLMVAAAVTTDGWDDLGVNYSAILVVGFGGWMLIFAALFAFPAGQLWPRWTRVPLAALPILLVEAVTLPPESFNITLLSLVLFFVAAGAALLARYRRLPSGEERQQLRWAFLGFMAGVGLVVTGIVASLIFFQLRSIDYRWDAWAVFLGVFDVLGCIVAALGLLISVLRFRLYDADTVIGRSAAYGVLTAGFVALFAGTEKLAEIIGEHYFEHSIGIAAGAIAAAVAAACIVPLHNRVHRWAERRFQKPLIRLREGLPECLADLRDTASVGQIAEAVMKRIDAGVRSTREAVLLFDEAKLRIAGTHSVASGEVREWQRRWTVPGGERALDCDRKDMIFPVRLRLCIENADEPETIGWLLLGPRPDGSLFGKDEREALGAIAGPVARAIHIAQLRERREAEAERRLGALETLIARLASVVGEATAAPA
jgi:hypothetical protein